MREVWFWRKERLEVHALGPDGYHDVLSVYQAVSLFEEVTVSPAQPGQGVSVTVRRRTLFPDPPEKDSTPLMALPPDSL